MKDERFDYFIEVFKDWDNLHIVTASDEPDIAPYFSEAVLRDAARKQCALKLTWRPEYLFCNHVQKGLLNSWVPTAQYTSEGVRFLPLEELPAIVKYNSGFSNMDVIEDERVPEGVMYLACSIDAPRQAQTVIWGLHF